MRKILLLMLVMAGVLTSHATNYYVSTTGNNTNNGTSLATAFMTIQKAHDVSSPGDTIWVADGIYNEEVVVTRNGTSSAYIVYKSMNKWGAQVTNFWYNCFTVKASYITIDGFELIAPSTFGSGIGAMPISKGNFIHHLIFTNNKCHDSGQSGIATQDCDYVTITNNVCYKNSWLMPYSGSGISIFGRSTFDNNPGYHYIVTGNISYLNDNGPSTNKTDGNGIIIDDLRNTQGYHLENGLTTDVTYTTHAVLVADNLCYSNGGKGITMPWSNNITLRNNTIYGNNTRQDQGEWSGELNLPFCSNITVVNNICVGTLPLSSGIFVGGGTGNFVTSNLNFYNNIAYSTVNASQSATSVNFPISVCGVNGNLCNVDPLFANAGANFHLQSNSPAINAGTSAYGLSALDLDGYARAQGSMVDIGTYETSATAVAVSEVSFDPSTIIIPMGTNQQLITRIAPANASNQVISYASSNPSIASVNAVTGEVTAVALGTSNITATTQNGNKTATCNVTVTRPNTISIVSAPVEINPTGTYTVNVNYSVGQSGLVKVLIIGPAPSYSYYGESNFAVETNQVGSNVPVTITITSPLPAKDNYTFYATVSDNNQKEFATASIFFNVLPINATAVSVSPASTTIGLTSSQSLVANFTPSNTTNQNVNWVSSNSSIASIDPITGLVTGVGPGTAIVTATTQDGSFTSTSTITVDNSFGGSISGSVSDSVLTVNLTSLGKTDWKKWGTANTRKSLDANYISDFSAVGPNSALLYTNDRRKITWTDGTPAATSTGDFSGLYISGIDNGFSLIIPAGTTTSTLYLYVGGWNASGKLTASLSDNSSGNFVSTTPFSADVFSANYKLTFKAKTNGQTLTVKWVVADGTGNVSLQAAAFEKGITITGISLTPSSTSMKVDSTKQLTPNYTPANASNKNVSWSSSNPTIATVNYQGLVTALAAGSVTITATSQDATKTATSLITVIVPVTSVSVSPTSASIIAGNNKQLTATVNPTNATNKSVSWSSSNATVASVDNAGLITALVPGTATITVTSADGNKTATSLITVAAGGSITGSVATNTQSVSLSTIGTSDWKHFRYNDHKANGSMINSISNYTIIGNGPSYYNNDLRGMSWTGGTPAVSSSANKNGLYISGLNNGFSFNVPAGSGTNTLYVYVGGWNSGGTLTAHLSDNSAVDYVNTTPTTSGQYDKVYTITYHAASTGRNINIKWVLNSGTGNVTIQAAALVASASGARQLSPVIDEMQEVYSGNVIFPNPVRSNETLHVHSGEPNENYQIYITNVLGVVIYNQFLTGNMDIKISDTGMMQGIYFVTIRKEKQLKSYRLVIE